MAAAGDQTSCAQFALQLFDRLWTVYSEQVPYALEYERVLKEVGGRFVNDHVAFRTLRGAQPNSGIDRIAKLFLALGYQAQEPLEFPATKLHAMWYRHDSEELPKLFVSELLVEEFGSPTRENLLDALSQAKNGFDARILQELQNCEELNEEDYAELLDKMTSYFTLTPWLKAPSAEEVKLVNEQSQYGAWVMLFGNNVNHFTGFVNAIGVPQLDSIEKVAEAMRKRGVPMKDEIEGAPGSKLRQTATHAAKVKVPVRSGEIEWPYAYFEIAERGEDPDHPGQLFQGFLGQQAQQLFEMTRTTSNQSSVSSMQ